MDGWCSFFFRPFPSSLSFFSSSLGASLIIGFQSNQLELGWEVYENEIFFLLKPKKKTVLHPLSEKQKIRQNIVIFQKVVATCSLCLFVLNYFFPTETVSEDASGTLTGHPTKTALKDQTYCGIFHQSPLI